MSDRAWRVVYTARARRDLRRLVARRQILAIDALAAEVGRNLG